MKGEYIMTRKENLEKCKNLLYRGILDLPMSEEDTNYLTTQIFPLHKHWKEKCKGKKIKYVMVHHHEVYQNRCFALVLEDGEVVNISFLECINRPGLIKDIEAACDSAINNVDCKIKPSIIKEWVKKYDNEELTLGRYLTVDNTNGRTIFSSLDIVNDFKNFYNSNV